MLDPLVSSETSCFFFYFMKSADVSVAIEVLAYWMKIV